MYIFRILSLFVSLPRNSLSLFIKPNIPEVYSKLHTYSQHILEEYNFHNAKIKRFQCVSKLYLKQQTGPNLLFLYFIIALSGKFSQTVKRVNWKHENLITTELNCKPILEWYVEEIFFYKPVGGFLTQKI